MTDPKAVFLSYASDDAAPAQRIADALREAGVTLWFDKDELRGGDAWDTSIRQQIRACALFIPIISAHTESRKEGYFRREWNLAVERTLDMAQGVPFIVPVAIDETVQIGSMVPDKFRAVQWTRLPQGHANPVFVSRIQSLLGNGSQDRQGSGQAGAEVSLPAPAGRRTPVRALLALVLVGLALAYGGWRFTNGSRAEVAAGTAVSDKSIAVLPFTDLSEKHDQEYFSDGLTEELIDRLAQASGLKVIARTSSFQFKGKNEDIRDIASRLGVAHILEGSVRKSGANLRVTAQLIRAADGTHLWSRSYDSKLADVFATQEEIANEVVAALHVALDTGPTDQSPDKPNVEAYDLVLLGNHFQDGFSKVDLEKAIGYYRQAISVDPRYAEAWRQLGRAQFHQGVQEFVAPQEAARQARVSLDNAKKLDPKSVKVHASLAFVSAVLEWDWAGANAELEEIRRINPNDMGESQSVAALLATINGQMDTAIEFEKTQLRRDPISMVALYNLLLGYYGERHFAEAVGMCARIRELRQGLPLGTTCLESQLHLGNFRGAEAEIPTLVDEDERLWARALVLWTKGNTTEAIGLWREYETRFGTKDPLSVARSYGIRNDAASAVRWLDRAYVQHSPSMAWLKTDSAFDTTRADARFIAILQKMKLAN
jgi:TolB-like protein